MTTFITTNDATTTTSVTGTGTQLQGIYAFAATTPINTSVAGLYVVTPIGNPATLNVQVATANGTSNLSGLVVVAPSRPRSVSPVWPSSASPSVAEPKVRYVSSAMSGRDSSESRPFLFLSVESALRPADRWKVSAICCVSHSSHLHRPRRLQRPELRRGRNRVGAFAELFRL